MCKWSPCGTNLHWLQNWPPCVAIAFVAQFATRLGTTLKYWLLHIYFVSIWFSSFKCPAWGVQWWGQFKFLNAQSNHHWIQDLLHPHPQQYNCHHQAQELQNMVIKLYLLILLDEVVLLHRAIIERRWCSRAWIITLETGLLTYFTSFQTPR